MTSTGSRAWGVGSGTGSLDESPVHAYADIRPSGLVLLPTPGSLLPRSLALTLAAIAVFASSAPAQTKIDQRIPVAPDVSLRVFSLTGSIRITGWNRDTVWASGSVASGGGMFFMGGGYTAAKLGVDHPNERADLPPARLEVRVPLKSRVWIHTASATVEVSGLTGALDVQTVSGTVRIDGDLRQLSVETMEGDIVLNGSAPWLRAKSAGGGITLTGRSDDLGVSTVSGLVTITGKSFQRCHVSSVTSDIRFVGALSPDATCEFDSHAGSIEITLPATTDAEFEVSTLGGSIENAFGRGPGEIRKSVRGQAAAFATGKGSARVVVKNFKGNIVLAAK